MLVVLAVCAGLEAPRSSSSTRRFLGWLVEHAPGPLANDARVLRQLVSWESSEVSRTGLTVCGLKIVSEPKSESTLVEAARVDFKVDSLWPHVLIRLRLTNSSVSIKAFDAQLVDTNFRRLREHLDSKLRTKGGRSTKIGIAGLDLEGTTSVSVEPSDGLGGSDLKVKLELGDLGSLSKAIYEAAPLSLGDIYRLCVEYFSSKLRVALAEALARRTSLLPPGFTIGSTRIREAADFGHAVESVLAKRLAKLVESPSARLFPSRRTGISESLAELLLQLADEIQPHP